MVSKHGSVWIQSGVVSFGTGCGEPDFPGVYARVSQYQSWINSTIGSDQLGFVTVSSSDGNSGASLIIPSLFLALPPLLISAFPLY